MSIICLMLSLTFVQTPENLGEKSIQTIEDVYRVGEGLTDFPVRFFS